MPTIPPTTFRALAATLAIVLGTASAASPPDGYRDHDALAAAARDLATHDHCTLEVLGASREGRGLFALVLAAPGGDANARPAVLITAGLDGRHLVGSETALRVAQGLLAEHADLLASTTVYVIPRANPDGAEVNFSDVRTGQVGTTRAIDDDHDGDADEDPPVDLDGDGFITTMRRADPPLDGPPATHAADPAAPRLLETPDAAKGERATYALYTEGIDADGDGDVAEDGPGVTDLDRNFMHRWPEHEAGAGTYPLSEPEAAALARFVLDHPNIIAAVTYGRHDNLVNAPDSKKKDVTGRAPVDIDEGDAKLYETVAERFKEITAQTRAPKEDSAGAFYAWLYAQRGISSLATVVWGRPDASEEDGDTDADADAHTDTDTDADTDADTDTDTDADKPADAEAAAWLDYSDRDRDGAGFVEWKAFDHPTLGAVEIGGFVPGFRMNPPADELDDLAAKQTEFVVEIIGRKPQLSYEGPEVERLADGLYDIRFAIVNDGWLPTATAMARRARSIPPIVVRLSSPVDEIVAGARVSRAWGIDGSGGRSSHHWIVRAAPGAAVTIDVVSRQLGDERLELRMPD